MGHTRRAVLGSAAAITTGLAGCTGSQDGGDGSDGGGSDGDDGGSDPTPTATPDPTPTDTATPAPTAEADETVVVGPDGDLVFDPAELDVDVGTTVRWRWDSGGHTVTVESQPDGADWTATDQQTHSSGYTHTHTFEVAGTYEYVCLPHESAGMIGSVVVGDVGTPTSESDATVRVRDHPDLGEILVGPDGRTLYMFDRDTQGAGASSCSGDCAGAWPPLTVDGEPIAGDGVTADLTTFEREDGSTQVAAAGWPLYYFADDEDSGDANGQGAGGVWWVLGPDGTPKRAEPTPTPEPSTTVDVRDHPDLGEILVGPDGRTLYMFDRDTQGDGASSCSGDCAGAWPPLTVDGEPTASEAVGADLTTFEREDGSIQVAAAGWPLYYFADDEEPGDANGQGAGGVWWVLGPEGTPKRPEATPTPTPTSMSSDGGEDGGDEDGGDPY